MLKSKTIFPYHLPKLLKFYVQDLYNYHFYILFPIFTKKNSNGTKRRINGFTLLTYWSEYLTLQWEDIGVYATTKEYKGNHNDKKY